MDEHADTRGHRVRSETDDIVRLQTILARRVLLIFALPLLVIIALGVYAYRLSGKMDTLNTLQHINFIERVMQKSHAHEWALKEYEKLAKEYPHPQVLVRLGALYYADNRPHEALERLKAAEDRDPQYWEIYSTAAYIHGQEGDVEQAIQAGAKALELNPWDAQTYNNLAWLYAMNDDVLDLPKAQDYAVNAVKYTRGLDLNSLDTLIDVYTKAGHIDRAIETIEDAINRINREVAGAKYFQARLNTLRELQTSVRKE